MKKIRTIRRLHRQASDAHLVPPPRMTYYRHVTNFCYFLERPSLAICRAVGMRQTVAASAMDEQRMMEELVRSGAVKDMWLTKSADGEASVTVIRKPRISKKLLANLTQRQKQAIGEK